VVVSVRGDATYETNETFRLALSNPTNATVITQGGNATIVDDDPVPTASIADAQVTEGDVGTVTAAFVVTLSNPSAFPISYRVKTGDGSAHAGADYLATNVVLAFDPGQTSKTVGVPIVGDPFTEWGELFTATLSQPQGVTTIARGSALGDIVDNDPRSGTMAFDPQNWGFSEDTNVDGVYDNINSGIYDVAVRRGAALSR